VLRAMVASPQTALGRLPILSADEYELLVSGWNHTDRAVPGPACVHTAVAHQTARQPDKTAVICGDTTLSYSELGQRAQRLAEYLRRRGVGPGHVVGVCMDRSADLVVTLLGVLQAGAAYLPLDPDYPSERLAFMVSDSDAALVLGSADALAALDTRTDRVATAAILDDATEPATPAVSASPALTTGDHLAYIIYTSGSTGRPKGVTVPHSGVSNLLAAMDEHLGDGAQSVWLALTSISFDISVLELFWPLTRGGTVVLGSDTSALLGHRPQRRSMPAVDFGLFYFADDEGARSGRERYRLLLDGARFADTHGFSSVWTPERHFHAFGGLYPNPSVTGAALAAITERVGIRAGSVVLPLHHPVRVAEEWSLVDNLSGGRAGIAIASGWHANDFVFAPERYAERKAAMMEGIATIRALWRGETVSWRGGNDSDVAVQLRPRPVQTALPMWLTAAGNPATFEAAGRIGANVL
ncbi:MAG: MupA/Atu3671 family FMN-dependent luciferase-like monooxygenase, partial [Myxococcota bacterium]